MSELEFNANIDHNNDNANYHHNDHNDFIIKEDTSYTIKNKNKQEEISMKDSNYIPDKYQHINNPNPIKSLFEPDKFITISNETKKLNFDDIQNSLYKTDKTDPNNCNYIEFYNNTVTNNSFNIDSEDFNNDRNTNKYKITSNSNSNKTTIVHPFNESKVDINSLYCSEIYTNIISTSSSGSKYK